MGNKSSSPGTKEQWDKLKILLWGGPGQDFDILAWDRPERDGTDRNGMGLGHFAAGPGLDFDSLSHSVPGQRSLSWDFCCCSCPGTK